jgi:hypothetical protein
VNAGQTALLIRLRELVEETPKSGALNAGKRVLHITRFAQAVERRAEDGDALVKYARAKVHEAPTGSYTSLIEARRPDLTVEAVVANTDAEWAGEFTEDDRCAARGRLGDMIEAHRQAQTWVEAEAVARDRKIVAAVSASRVSKGMPGLTPEQEASMLEERSARRGRPKSPEGS